MSATQKVIVEVLGQTQEKENVKKPKMTKAGEKSGKPRKRSVLSLAQKELLISEVSTKPHLWQMGHKDYHDVNMSSNTWFDLSQKLMMETGLDAVDAYWEWKQLRDTYTSTKRKLETRSGQGAMTKAPCWPFFEQMRFLEGIVGEESLFDSMNQGDNSGSIDDIEIDSDKDVIDDSYRYAPVDDDDIQYIDEDQLSMFSGFIDRDKDLTPIPPTAANSSTPVQPTAARTRPITPQARTDRKKRQKAGSKTDSLDGRMDEILSVAKNLLNTTEEETFGLHLAQQLKKVDEGKKLRCMKALTDCLYEFLSD